MKDRSVLIVDDERKMAIVLDTAFRQKNYASEFATSGEDALARFRQNPVHLVITDLKMPEMDGIAVLEAIKKMSPETEIILMTAYATAQTAVEAMKKGAYDYVFKPFSLDELLLKADRVFEKKRLQLTNQMLEKKLQDKFSVENMIGQSGHMQQVFKMIERVACKEATVLILGESGTGKELVAHSIHNLSPRQDAPFVAVNCSAFPENLLESELFGYEKGAFTGADRRKPGYFERAGTGTILLDEIGEISMSVQVKLLRVLQEKRFVRLGGTEEIVLKARIITATNRVLEEMIKTGEFREDLYYRVNVFPIMLPPLRSRKDDIPALASHFIEKYQKGSSANSASPEVIHCLQSYDWPGNVRELENVIERSLIMATGPAIEVDDLPGHICGRTQSTTNLFEIPDEGVVLEDVEKKLLQSAIQKAKGNKSRAAQLLGITRRRLYSMMERFGGF